MRFGLYQHFHAILVGLTLGILFALFCAHSGRAQEQVKTAVIASIDCPSINDTLTASIIFNMRKTTELLGSFTGSLKWDPTILEYVADSGLLAGFLGNANTAEAANGNMSFNGINPGGVGDSIAVLEVTFKVLALPDSDSTLIDLEFSAIAAARTFKNLLPITTISDAIACKVTGVYRQKGQPDDFSLQQNYPNPFNPRTVIRFSLPTPISQPLMMQILDLQGRLVREWHYEKLSPGIHEIGWDGKDRFGKTVPSGQYYYRLISDQFTETKKMLLVR